MVGFGSSAMRSGHHVLSFLPSSWTLAVWLMMAGLLLGMAGLGDGYECGGFIELTPTSSGRIESPGYPGSYPNYTRCIWILQAPDRHVPQLSVNFQGEMFASSCSDYVEFRDGGQSGDLILINCAVMTSETVTSTGRWMYVFFGSDGFSQVDGLSANYSAHYLGEAINNNISDPITGCRSYEFECSNRLCLSMSYRCDGYYDCGCGADCDEDGCGGLSIDKPTQMAIGFAVGVSVFVLAAALGLLLEKRHNWEKERGGGEEKDPHVHRRHHWSTLKDNRVSADHPPPPAPPPAPCAIQVSEVV